MLTLERVLECTEATLKKQGTTIRSRQIRALAAAMVTEINRELELIQHHPTQPEG